MATLEISEEEDFLSSVVDSDEEISFNFGKQSEFSDLLKQVQSVQSKSTKIKGKSITHKEKLLMKMSGKGKSKDSSDFDSLLKIHKKKGSMASSKNPKQKQNKPKSPKKTSPRASPRKSLSKSPAKKSVVKTLNFQKKEEKIKVPENLVSVAVSKVPEKLTDEKSTPTSTRKGPIEASKKLRPKRSSSKGSSPVRKEKAEADAIKDIHVSSQQDNKIVATPETKEVMRQKESVPSSSKGELTAKKKQDKVRSESKEKKVSKTEIVESHHKNVSASDGIQASSSKSDSPVGGRVTRTNKSGQKRKSLLVDDSRNSPTITRRSQSAPNSEKLSRRRISRSSVEDKGDSVDKKKGTTDKSKEPIVSNISEPKEINVEGTDSVSKVKENIGEVQQDSIEDQDSTKSTVATKSKKLRSQPGWIIRKKRLDNPVRSTRSGKITVQTEQPGKEGDNDNESSKTKNSKSVVIKITDQLLGDGDDVCSVASDQQSAKGGDKKKGKKKIRRGGYGGIKSKWFHRKQRIQPFIREVPTFAAKLESKKFYFKRPKAVNFVGLNKKYTTYSDMSVSIRRKWRLLEDAVEDLLETDKIGGNKRRQMVKWPQNKRGYLVFKTIASRNVSSETAVALEGGSSELSKKNIIESKESESFISEASSLLKSKSGRSRKKKGGAKWVKKKKRLPHNQNLPSLRRTKKNDESGIQDESSLYDTEEETTFIAEENVDTDVDSNLYLENEENDNENIESEIEHTINRRRSKLEVTDIKQNETICRTEDYICPELEKIMAIEDAVEDAAENKESEKNKDISDHRTNKGTAGESLIEGKDIPAVISNDANLIEDEEKDQHDSSSEQLNLVLEISNNEQSMEGNQDDIQKDKCMAEDNEPKGDQGKMQEDTKSPEKLKNVKDVSNKSSSSTPPKINMKDHDNDTMLINYLLEGKGSSCVETMVKGDVDSKTKDEEHMKKVDSDDKRNDKFVTRKKSSTDRSLTSNLTPSKTGVNDNALTLETVAKVNKYLVSNAARTQNVSSQDSHESMVKGDKAYADDQVLHSSEDMSTLETVAKVNKDLVSNAAKTQNVSSQDSHESMVKGDKAYADDQVLHSSEDMSKDITPNEGKISNYVEKSKTRKELALQQANKYKKKKRGAAKWIHKKKRVVQFKRPHRMEHMLPDRNVNQTKSTSDSTEEEMPSSELGEKRAQSKKRKKKATVAEILSSKSSTSTPEAAKDAQGIISTPETAKDTQDVSNDASNASQKDLTDVISVESKEEKLHASAHDAETVAPIAVHDVIQSADSSVVPEQKVNVMTARRMPGTKKWFSMKNTSPNKTSTSASSENDDSQLNTPHAEKPIVKLKIKTVQTPSSGEKHTKAKKKRVIEVLPGDDVLLASSKTESSKDKECSENVALPKEFKSNISVSKRVHDNVFDKLGSELSASSPELHQEYLNYDFKSMCKDAPVEEKKPPIKLTLKIPVEFRKQLSKSDSEGKASDSPASEKTPKKRKRDRGHKKHCTMSCCETPKKKKRSSKCGDSEEQSSETSSEHHSHKKIRKIKYSGVKSTSLPTETSITDEESPKLYRYKRLDKEKMRKQTRKFKGIKLQPKITICGSGLIPKGLECCSSSDHLMMPNSCLECGAEVEISEMLRPLSCDVRIVVDDIMDGWHYGELDDVTERMLSMALEKRKDVVSNYKESLKRRKLERKMKALLKAESAMVEEDEDESFMLSAGDPVGTDIEENAVEVPPPEGTNDHVYYKEDVIDKTLSNDNETNIVTQENELSEKANNALAVPNVEEFEKVNDKIDNSGAAHISDNSEVPEKMEMDKVEEIVEKKNDEAKDDEVDKLEEKMEVIDCSNKDQSSSKDDHNEVTIIEDDLPQDSPLSLVKKTVPDDVSSSNEIPKVAIQTVSPKPLENESTIPKEQIKSNEPIFIVEDSDEPLCLVSKPKMSEEKEKENETIVHRPSANRQQQLGERECTVQTDNQSDDELERLFDSYRVFNLMPPAHSRVAAASRSPAVAHRPQHRSPRDQQSRTMSSNASHSSPDKQHNRQTDENDNQGDVVDDEEEIELSVDKSDDEPDYDEWMAATMLDTADEANMNGFDASF